MQSKWLVVAAFYGFLIFAVAQPSSKEPDLLWIAVSFAMMLVMSACRVIEWLRNGRIHLRGRGPLNWYIRFMTDSADERPARRT
jgi:hypothetical protein